MEFENHIELKKLCWICNQREANSGEHKFKASILKRYFGKKYSNEEVLYGKGSETKEYLDSYKSSHVKFPKVICSDCNESLTRPHDDAFDVFVKYVESNYDQLKQNANIDFKQVFGELWVQEKLNLYRYIAKHAGCKVITWKDYNGTPGLKDLSNFILGSNMTKSLRVHFQLKEGIKTLSDLIGRPVPNIHNSETIYFGRTADDLNLGGWISHQWISIVWIVSMNISQENQCDFQRPIESIELKLLKDNVTFKNMSNVREVLNAIEYSGLSKIEDRTAYFERLIYN